MCAFACCATRALVQLRECDAAVHQAVPKTRKPPGRAAARQTPGAAQCRTHPSATRMRRELCIARCRLLVRVCWHSAVACLRCAWAPVANRGCGADITLRSNSISPCRFSLRVRFIRPFVCSCCSSLARLFVCLFFPLRARLCVCVCVFVCVCVCLSVSVSE